VPSPLTGLPMDARNAARPVLAVALTLPDRIPSSAELSHADIVYEEQPAGRAVALFHTTIPSEIGPVGDTRPLDGKLLAVAHPVFAYRGGPSGFVTVLQASGVVGLSELVYPSAYHGSTVDTSALLSHAPQDVAAPPPLLAYNTGGLPLATAGVSQATRVSAPGATWRYDARTRTWRSSNGASVTNLIFQEVTFKTVLLHHPGGQPVPSALPFGHGGRSTVLSGAHAVKGSWIKPGPKNITNYADTAGAAVRLTPGRTWVVLIPKGAHVDTR